MIKAEQRLRLRISRPVSGWVSVLVDGHSFLARPLLLEGPEEAAEADGSNSSGSGGGGVAGQAGCEILQNTDFLGGDLPASPIDVAGPLDCCRECNAHPECVTWTFTAGGSCWIKGPDTNQQPTTEGHTSGRRAVALGQGQGQGQAKQGQQKAARRRAARGRGAAAMTTMQRTKEKRGQKSDTRVVQHIKRERG